MIEVGDICECVISSSTSTLVLAGEWVEVVKVDEVFPNRFIYCVRTTAGETAWLTENKLKKIATPHPVDRKLGPVPGTKAAV